MQKLIVLFIVLITLENISVAVYLFKTLNRIKKYVDYIEKFEKEKPSPIRYLVVSSSYRECEKLWENSKQSSKHPKTEAKFVTVQNAPFEFKGYWNDVHSRKVKLIGITLREFDSLYYRN